MVPNKLRIVYAHDDQVDSSPVIEAPTKVKVRLEEVFPVLAEAMANNHSWIDDFADDSITISSDLYEVLLAYQHHRQQRAA